VPEKLLRWIRPEIQKLSAYHVANADGLIKLDAMENPYLLAENIRHDLQQKLAVTALNRYPDPHAKTLTAALHTYMRVASDRAIILGNGSDELIQILAMSVLKKNTCLMAFEPGFVMYRMIAEFVGIDYVGVPLDASFNLNMSVTRDAIEKYQPAIIFIAYPNNPSANLFDSSMIETIVRLAPGLVVVDEAYYPFAQKTFLPSLSEFENLMVMRTVSKLGLAGIRLGFLCGSPIIINEIDKLRLPYNINVLTQTVAIFMLENMDVLEQQARLICEQRTAVFAAMNKFDNLDVFPSQANFILFRVRHKSADEVFDIIKNNGVLIKNMKAKEGPLQNCLRVTIGTSEENKFFLRALEKALHY